jgi:hypothetical protein
MKKKWFKIPCLWGSCGVLEIEAKDIKEAIKVAKKEAETCELPDAEYIDGSFELNLDSELIKLMNR